jgi:hypothetical protein
LPFVDLADFAFRAVDDGRPTGDATFEEAGPDFGAAFEATGFDGDAAFLTTAFDAGLAGTWPDFLAAVSAASRAAIVQPAVMRIIARFRIIAAMGLAI